MNERIRELHGQAYLYALHNETKAREGGCHEPGTFNNDYREKFAELIVRECIEQIKTQGISASSEDYGDYEIGFNAGLFHALRTTKEHFGVEE